MAVLSNCWPIDNNYIFYLKGKTKIINNLIFCLSLVDVYGRLTREKCKCYERLSTFIRKMRDWTLCISFFFSFLFFVKDNYSS